MAKAPRVSVQITADSTGYTAAVNKAKGQLIEFAAVSKQVSNSSVNEFQATSAAMRAIDGSMNIRAAERFLTTIKGVGPALQAIFPAVGLIAVVSVIARGVTELTEFIKKTKEAGAEFRASFQEMQNSARLSNDELAKTNINLENQIAKLTGRHENVLASQLIEARIEADKLATSAAAAGKQMKELLEKNQAGVLARIMGSDSTSDVFGNINNFQNLKSKAQQDQDDALHNGDQKGADAAKAQYQQALANERAYLKQQIGLRSGYVKYAQTPNGPALVQTDKNDPGATTYSNSQGDQTRNLDALHAAQNLNYDQSDRIDLDAQHTKDSKALQAAQDAKNFADKAAAAQRKADSDHLTALKEAFELQKSAAGQQIWESKTNFEQRQRLAQSNFYLGHLNDFKTPEARKEAFDLGQKPLDEYNTTDTEGRAALQKMLADNGSAAGVFAGLGTDKDTQARLKAQQEAISAQAELSNKLRETAISQDLQNGTISKYDAAVQMAALHTEAYQLQLEKLQAEAQQIANDPTLNEEQRRTKLIGLGAQVGELGQQKDSQHGVDQQNIADNTVVGEWKQSVNQFVEANQGAASAIRTFWDGLSSVNDELVKLVSSKHNYNTRQEFGNIGAGIFRGVAGAGLNKAEGALMGALHLGGGGKPDGSSSKPFHVIMAGVAGAASAAGGALSKATNGASDAVGSAVGRVVGQAAGGIGGFLGKIGGFFSGLGFKDGGHPPVGKFSLVGENGPELRYFGSPSTIVPAGGFGGTSITHHIAVDARGATDQAMVHAAVQRGIMKALPSITAASMHAQREAGARKPSRR